MSVKAYLLKGVNPSQMRVDGAKTGVSIQKDPVLSDPTSGQRDGPSKDIDPGDSHSGEGLASVRPRLARTLAASALRSADKQRDAISSRTPLEPPPQTEAATAHHP